MLTSGFWAALDSSQRLLVMKNGNFTTDAVVIQTLVTFLMCLLLFNFQRFQIVAPCILSGLYSCVQCERKGEACLLPFTWNDSHELKL